MRFKFVIESFIFSLPRVILHDLMMEYLEQLTVCQELNQELNQNLIHGYREYCNGEWSTYPEKRLLLLSISDTSRYTS